MYTFDDINKFAFSVFDKDDSGTIDENELMQLLHDIQVGVRRVFQRLLNLQILNTSAVLLLCALPTAAQPDDFGDVNGSMV